MIKTLSRLILGFVLLAVVAVVILLMSVNTEQNKAAIQAAVLSSTGYELTIAGDMDIAFFPSIGLTLNDVRLKNPASPQELASTTAALLQVDLRALIGGEILVRELSTDDFHINYYIAADGVSNWDVETDGTNSTAASSSAQNSTPTGGEASASTSGGSSVSLSVERLRIGNASVDFQDLSQGSRFSVNNLNLASTNTNIEGRPFEVEVDFNFLNNGMSKPMAMGFRGDIAADIEAGTVAVRDIAFNLTPLLIQGEIDLSGLQDAIAFDGTLTSNDFDVFGLMQTIGMRTEDDDSTSALLGLASRPRASMELQFSGDELGVEISRLLLMLDDSRIEADATITFATDLLPTNISYEVVSNRIDLSAFLAAEETTSPATAAPTTDSDATAGESTTTPAPQAAESVAIPGELLSAFNVLGSIAIESIVANDYAFTGINIFTNVEDSVLDVEVQPISAFQGSLAGNVRLDGRSPEPVLTTQFAIEQMNLVELAPTISRLNAVTGNLDVELDLTATGQTTTAMMDSLNGSTAFAISDNSVDIGVIKQVFTAISALSPTGGTIEQWPDVIRFAELGGFILINDGIEGDQQLNLRMDNFDVSGTGGLDLSAQNFDYDLLFTVLGEPYLQTIQVDDIYHDVSWPVECAAAFADEVSQYCRPDFTQVRQIFTQLGTNAVRERLNEVITDQVPEEIRDGARGLLRNLLN